MAAFQGLDPDGQVISGSLRKASEAGVIAKPLSTFYLQPGSPQGLILGFGAFRRVIIEAGAERLAGVLRDLRT